MKSYSLIRIHLLIILLLCRSCRSLPTQTGVLLLLLITAHGRRATRSHRLVRVFENAVFDFVDVLPQNGVYIHVGMVALSIHVGCSLLHILHKGIAASS